MKLHKMKEKKLTPPAALEGGMRYRKKVKEKTVNQHTQDIIEQLNTPEHKKVCAYCQKRFTQKYA